MDNLTHATAAQNTSQLECSSRWNAVYALAETMIVARIASAHKILRMSGPAPPYGSVEVEIISVES